MNALIHGGFAAEKEEIGQWRVLGRLAKPIFPKHATALKSLLPPQAATFQKSVY